MNHIISRIDKADAYREKQVDFFWKPEISVCDFEPVKIEVPWFSNVWVHSEHQNETGTHKDRKALTLSYYMKMLAGHPEVQDHIPISEQVYSLITSWSAWVSLWNAIKKAWWPSLKTLVWIWVSQNVLEVLEEYWCEIYRIQLNNEQLSSRDILNITDNIHWIDLTSQHDEIFINSYLQLAHDMLYWNKSDYDHIITPYWTGELYNAITLMSLWDIETFSDYIDYISGIPLWVPFSTWKPVSVWGVSTDNSSSIMNKLYAPSLPFLPWFQWWGKQWWPVYTLENLFPRSKKLKDTWIVNISDNCIKHATEIFQSYQIPVEPSALSSLAMLLENPDRFDSDEKILLVSTGKCKI